jgi:hypothetical protein
MSRLVLASGEWLSCVTKKATANRGLPYSLGQYKDDPGSRQNQKIACKESFFRLVLADAKIRQACADFSFLFPGSHRPLNSGR